VESSTSNQACRPALYSRAGRPDVAAAGKLYVITAGEPDAIAAAGNLFNAIGQQIFNVSETRKAANLVKLSGNFLIASVIESVGEALALVSRKRR
jgi:3-hydroxyisobutyrate dehydrogenase-like beta-hydroxyacid dehydrogenase